MNNYKNDVYFKRSLQKKVKLIYIFLKLIINRSCFEMKESISTKKLFIMN